MFLFSRGHDTSRRYETVQLPDGLDYNTSLVYAREVENTQLVIVSHYGYWVLLHGNIHPSPKPKCTSIYTLTC